MARRPLLNSKPEGKSSVGLENRYGSLAHREFKSLPLRHEPDHRNGQSSQSVTSAMTRLGVVALCTQSCRRLGALLFLTGILMVACNGNAPTAGTPTTPPVSQPAAAASATPVQSPAASSSPTMASATPSATPQLQPQPRTGASLAYDGATGSTLLFGGSSTGAIGPVLGDTWTLDGSSWHEARPAHAPAARSSASAAFDAARNVVVLFGGNVLDSSLVPASPAWSDETWTWDGVDWTLQHPAHKPSARGIAAFAYDEAHKQAVLFGGTGTPHSCCEGLSDTWAWDGSDWTHIQTAKSPPPTVGAGFAYDVGHGQLVLFGNYFPSGSDTWTFDGSNWTDHGAQASGPPQLDSPSVAFDAATASVVMFGGHHNAPTDVTWLWNGVSWAAAHRAQDAAGGGGPPPPPTPRGDLFFFFGGVWGKRGV